jgi:hypothetical protein
MKKLDRYEKVLRVIAERACQPLGKCVVIYHGKPNGHACTACLAFAALHPKQQWRSSHLNIKVELLEALGLP